MKHKTTLLALVVFALTFFGQVHEVFAVETGYGYVSLFAETLGNSTNCAANQTEFDFETKEFNSETSAIPQSIIVTVMDTLGAVLGTKTVTGSAQANTVCVDLSLSKIGIKVLGGAGYHDFVGTYNVSVNVSLWAGKRVRSHVHLAAIGQTQSVQPVQMGLWYNYQPEFQANVLETTVTHGVSGVYSIILYDDILGTTANIPIPCCTGVGTYSLEYPQTLPEGWHSMGFYAGLNGGSPDPLSSWSGFTAFGIDTTLPKVSASTTPDGKKSYAPDETFSIDALASDVSSGIQSIRIYVDEELIEECVFIEPGMQGDLEEWCIAEEVGPYSDVGGEHIVTVVAVDTAGNEKEYERNFFVACSQDLDVNTNQFKGCFYDYNTNDKYGDAPSGFVMASPVEASTTAIKIDFGTESPITGESTSYRAVYVGTFVFNPGLYEFQLYATDYASVSIYDGSQNEYMSGTSVGNSKRISVPTTLTIRIDYSNYNSGSGKLQFGWKEAVCDDTVGGTNQLIGCLYKDSNYGFLFGPAPVGLVTDPVAVSNTAIDYNWGAGAPAVGAPTNNFSAKWKGTFDFQPGWYRFFAGNDDTMSINFQSAIAGNVICSNNSITTGIYGSQVYSNNYPTTGNITNAFHCQVLAPGKITISLSMREYTGNAKVSFGWARLGGAVTYCDPSVVGTNQFKGCLYSHGGVLALEGSLPDGPDVTDLANPPNVKASIVATTSALDFDWGTGSPDPAFTNTDYWNATWRGNFTFPQGTYKFHIEDVYADAYIDGVEVLYYEDSSGSVMFEHTFDEQTTVLIEVDYQAYPGNRNVKFEWNLVPSDFVVTPVFLGGIFPGYVQPGMEVFPYSGCGYCGLFFEFDSIDDATFVTLMDQNAEYIDYTNEEEDPENPPVGLEELIENFVSLYYEGDLGIYQEIFDYITYASEADPSSEEYLEYQDFLAYLTQLYYGEFNDCEDAYQSCMGEGGDELYCENIYQSCIGGTGYCEGFECETVYSGAAYVEPESYYGEIGDILFLTLDSDGGYDFGGGYDACEEDYQMCTWAALSDEDYLVCGEIQQACIDNADMTYEEYMSMFYWSKYITSATFLNGISLVFPRISVREVYMETEYYNSEWYNLSGMLLGVSNSARPSGYVFRIDSKGGFTGTVSVDTTEVPEGITKNGTWPKTCFVLPYGSCDIELDLTIDESSNPYKNYHIKFDVTNSEGIPLKEIEKTIRVWGFEPKVTPSVGGVIFGASKAFDVVVESKNGWSGVADLSAVVSPAEPTITTLFTQKSIDIPVAGSAATTLRIITTEDTPEGVYSIGINAKGIAPEGIYTRVATATLYVSETPYVEVVPPPVVRAILTQSLTDTHKYKLSMVSIGATSCTWSRTSTYEGDWTDAAVPSPNISYESDYVSYSEGVAEWKFVCINSAGTTASSSVTLSLLDIPPTGEIWVGDSSIDSGATTTVFWRTENTGNCFVEVEGKTGGSVVDTWTGITSNLSGLETAKLYGNTAYALFCGVTPLGYANIGVDINPELRVSQRVVIQGNEVTLYWNTHNNNESACTLSHPGGSDLITVNSGDLSQGEVEIEVNAQTEYILSCPSSTGGNPLVDSNYTSGI